MSSVLIAATIESLTQGSEILRPEQVISVYLIPSTERNY